MPDKTASEGLFDLPYGIAHQRIAHVATRSGVPVGFWRSVGHSHNAFFAEGFIDELAHEAEQDPVAFRLALLAARAAPCGGAESWRPTRPAGASRCRPAAARGVALHESFGSIVAAGGRGLAGGRPAARAPRGLRGRRAAPWSTRASSRSRWRARVVFGLSAALHGRIDIDDGVVQQSNFPNYPLLTPGRDARASRPTSSPSTRPPGGVGEPGVPPIAPAVANALFALTGQRLRSLPLVMT